MERHPLTHSEKPPFVRRIIPVAMLGMLLALAPGAFGQHGAGGRIGNFSGGHVVGFAGGFRRGISAPLSFRGFSGPTPHSFGGVPRMTWPAPRYSIATRRGAYEGYHPPYAYRPPYRGGDPRGRDRRGHYRRPYPVSNYGYPYVYANSWELLPWDLGYPDFTGYGDDSDTSEPNYAQAPPPDEGQQSPPQESEDYRQEYAPAPYHSPMRPEIASTSPNHEPQLTLIFKDGHTMAVRNYMLTASEIIVMDDAASGREPRIPLADLNLPATEKAAQQDGLDFSPPST